MFHTDGAVARAVDGVSFTVAAGETLGDRGRVRQRQVGDLAVDHAAAGPGPPGGIVAGERGGIRDRQGLVQDLRAASDRDMRRLRGNEIGMVFQEPMIADPVFTIGDQIAEVVHPASGVGRAAGAA